MCFSVTDKNPVLKANLKIAHFDVIILFAVWLKIRYSTTNRISIDATIKASNYKRILFFFIFYNVVWFFFSLSQTAHNYNGSDICCFFFHSFNKSA